ncbi:MAG: deoxyribose-phosphate aldolase [Actinomycetota bacterium]|nr:deoxyribose-phosphate aldolase [Actinomycetota bacterium]
MLVDPTENIRVLARCLDLTSLNDDETEASIEQLCARAREPGKGLPPVAAVCVYPAFVGWARRALARSGVLVACATGAFPTGSLPTDERVAQIRTALEAGAQEIDTVLDHRAFLVDREEVVRQQLVASRSACGGTTMKVILETGLLPDASAVLRAAQLAIEAGADFVKTSTGKVARGATPNAFRAMCETARRSERPIGVKVSGGVRTTDDALAYLSIVEEVLGKGWLDPSRFRIGASSLLGDLLLHLSDPPLDAPG